MCTCVYVGVRIRESTSLWSTGASSYPEAGALDSCEKPSAGTRNGT